jgi:RimJ/RimL family protein N-acetyltransferase
MLRPFSVEDAGEVQKLAGVREIADTTLNVPHPYKDGMAEAWIKTHATGFAEGKLVAYAITDRDAGDLLGAISLVLQPAHLLAELGYWIGVPFWGRGYATEAAARLMDYGFSDLNLNRIEAHHLVKNPASGRVMQKLGMHYEGTFRQKVWKRDRFEDVAMYGLLAAEWRQGN